MGVELWYIHVLLYQLWKYSCIIGEPLGGVYDNSYFGATIHALIELWVHKAVVTYTVENVGGGIGQDPATEATYLGLNQPPFSSSVGNEVKNLGDSK